MPLLTWQLWLTRDQVNDRPLPWQKLITNLTLSLSCSVDGSSFSSDWHTITFSQTRVESHLGGLQDNLAVVKSVVLLSKKVLIDKKNSQSLLESLTFIF